MTLTPSTCHPLTAAYYPLLGDALTRGDDTAGYPLLCVLDAMLLPLQPVWDLAADSPTGRPGWQVLLDPQQVPYRLLPWLAQMPGVDLDAALTQQANRDRVTGLVRWHRGQADVVAAAAVERMPAGARVDIVERDPDADHLRIRVYVRQSTIAQRAAARAAVLAVLPAHITLVWEERTGQSYSDLASASASYTAVKTTYPTYGDVSSHTP